MAKRNNAYEAAKYAARLFTRTEGYARKVEGLFSVAVDELLKLAANGKPGEDGTFTFGSGKRLSEKSNRVLRSLYSSVYNEIKGDITAEWEHANTACDELIGAVYGKGLDEDNHFARWFSRNREAMDAFFKRKDAYGGLNLSQRVWRYVGELKTEMEVALSVTLGQGDSASTVSRKVRKYLNNPDDMFRRFRYKEGEDEDGNPVYGRKWKRKVIDPQTGAVTWKDFNPKDYHTGRGVYRSAYRNAMRLTRTETNMAYRASEQDRWRSMDFVLGYRVKRSNNHTEPDICDDLSAANDDNESQKGVYPKDFVFKGWHPQCRCFCVPILASRGDFAKMQKAILNGEEPPEPEGIVTEPNAKFNEWVKNNTGRIKNASTLPYWVKDNREAVKKAMKQEEKADGKERKANASTPLSPKEKARRSELKDEAKKILHGLEMSNPGFGKPITISNKAIKEWLNQPFAEYAEKNEALLNLPELIEEAEYLGCGADKHNDKFTAHLLQTRINKIVAWIVVRENAHGECWVHSISDSRDILDYITKKKE